MTAKKPKKLNKKPAPAKVVKKAKLPVKALCLEPVDDVRAKFTEGEVLRGAEQGSGAPTHTDLMVAPESAPSGYFDGNDDPTPGGIIPFDPPALTPATVHQSVGLAIEALNTILPSVIGQPESAPLLAKVKAWKADLESAESMLADTLKPHVITTGEPWGENGSKQLVLAGTRLKVKVANNPPADPALIKPEHLDLKKVEAVLRENLDLETDPLENYLQATVTYAMPSPQDPSTPEAPSRYVKLVEMLAEPEFWGPALRACLKQPTYSLMPPEEA